MTVAQQLPSGLSEQEVLEQGYELMLKELGRKSANYYFYTHEDYPSDLVNEYFYIQQKPQSVQSKYYQSLSTDKLKELFQ